nr:putative ferrochelatase [uncultured Mediterranean phage uvMED]
MTFENKKYQVIKKAISYDLANFIFNYFLLKRDAVNFMYKNNIHSESSILGTWKDQQVPNTFSCYSDFVMETLLMKVLPIMKEQTGLDLIPTYSYARVYKKGDVLKRHKDRPSCEISTTLNLGGDEWAIFIDPTGTNNVIDEYKNIHKDNAPKGDKVVLEVGDMLVYSGCELEHWREEFMGDICGQVFLHYNQLNGKFADSNKFDGRPLLGLPKF